MRSATAAMTPQGYLQAQSRWHPLEIAFWLATLLPFVLFPNYLSLASQIAITALFALSLDIILGYAGVVSLGHAAFFGIGAYSVYQAYLRMVREEKKAPAKYVIFNVFHDDHIRNLHGWQRFKFGVNRKSPSPTVPHLKVDLDKQTVADRPNPCPTEKSVYDLCDLDRVYALFRDDFYLQNRLMRIARNRFIFLSIFFVLILWGILAAIFNQR